MSGGLRTGRRLGIDWGSVRIGVAACDPRATVVTPVTTVPGNAAAMDALVELVEEYEPVEIIVGLPRSLSGDDGPAAKRISNYAAVLARRIAPIPVRFVDERLTTVTAAQTLRQQGRSSRQQREVIDQVAAMTILEHALESERLTGQPPGELVSWEEQP